MATQLYEDGNVVTLGGNNLECVGVSYQEPDGEKQKFVYSFRLKSELDAEREAEAKLQEELKAAADAAEGVEQ